MNMEHILNKMSIELKNDITKLTIAKKWLYDLGQMLSKLRKFFYFCDIKKMISLN